MGHSARRMLRGGSTSCKHARANARTPSDAGVPERHHERNDPRMHSTDVKAEVTWRPDASPVKIKARPCTAR